MVIVFQHPAYVMHLLRGRRDAEDVRSMVGRTSAAKEGLWV